MRSGASDASPQADMMELPVRTMRELLSEVSGSLGDFGTIIPLVLAAGMVSGMNVPIALLAMGAWFIIAALYYRIPVPVEPMKAIAVAVIAGVAGAGEVMAAGIILGIIFLVLGATSFYAWTSQLVPQALVRGIQLGLSLLLLISAWNLGKTGLLWFGSSVAVIIGFGVAGRYWKLPDLSALLLLGVLGAGTIVMYGFPHPAVPTLPTLTIPGFGSFVAASTSLVLPQAVLTLTNAILATSLLAQDLYGRSLQPARLSRTIGLMNLSAVPFGAFPMCHGAGGLAAQARFGAKTWLAGVFAGTVLIGLSLLIPTATSLSPETSGVFGALLVFTSYSLGKNALKDGFKVVTVVTGIATPLAGITGALVAGAILYAVLRRIEAQRKRA